MTAGVNARVFTRNQLIALVALVVLAIVAGTTAYTRFTTNDDYQITAQFVATPGLYEHNAVAILGVATGKVVSVTPRSGYVEVVMSLPKGTKIPAGAQAVLMAPNPVSDRTVELSPPYTGGPVMAAGDTIPLAKTVVPLELDQVYDAVSNLSNALGLKGANSDGQLSAVLHAFAQLADGNGKDLHTAITSIAAALPALTKNPDDLKNLVNGLDALTRTLAAHDATINSLYSDLASSTGQLADDRQIIASAVANLQRGMEQVATFIKANQENLGASVRNLSATMAAVMAEQDALIKTFDTAPLGFQNFNNTIETNGPCPSATAAPHNCEVLWGRLDLTKDASDFIKTYCGNSVLGSLIPIILGNAYLANSSALDTTCGAELGLQQNRPGPPGSPDTPDLDLTHQLGSK